jgi:hypothetical protein
VQTRDIIREIVTRSIRVELAARFSYDAGDRRTCSLRWRCWWRRMPRPIRDGRRARMPCRASGRGRPADRAPAHGGRGWIASEPGRHQRPVEVSLVDLLGDRWS